MFSRSTSAMWTGISARHPMQSLASTRNRALKEAKDMALTDRKIELRPDIELQRVIPLKQAAEVGGASAATIPTSSSSSARAASAFACATPCASVSRRPSKGGRKSGEGRARDSGTRPSR